MNITYIYHSGFLIETKRCYYLFDYYKGNLPKLLPNKPILVFFSHSHKDHYNPCIFDKLLSCGATEIYAVVSHDISTDSVPKDIECLVVKPDMEYLLWHGQKLTTLLSTDLGVAFLMQSNEGTIYHAGDLNDWVWEGETENYNKEMTKNYRTQIDKLSDKLTDTLIDVAFVALDPRQEKYYAKGILYFLKKVGTKKVFPMHYWEKPQLIQQFLQEYPEYKEIIQVT